MFRTLSRLLGINPFESKLKKSGRRILLYWNRGLGDIALGLFAVVQKIRELVPNAEITFLTRPNLVEGFSMLEGVRVIPVPGWKRGEKCPLPVDKKQFDLVLEDVSPTDWVSWQLGIVTPKLKWNRDNEDLFRKFSIPEGAIGVQVEAESGYALWRNWPEERWRELFALGSDPFVLFGFGDKPVFDNVIDLRGKTTLMELLSIVKNRCKAVILPDSGLLSMIYYLDESFPIKVISLWADPYNGILKQAVASPNPQLEHVPLIAEKKDLSTVSVERVVEALKPSKVGCVLLAGGQGTRLGHSGPKGTFVIAGKSLFQWFCEKVPPATPIAIMTSPLNHEATVAFFAEHENFGRQVFFFRQEMRKGVPNGNGSVFRSFARAGLNERFAEEGIGWISLSFIDNPLADPMDGQLLKRARQTDADVTVQCVERLPQEKTGVVKEMDGKVQIVEYIDNPEGTLANTGRMIFKAEFFRCAAAIELPWHFVVKQGVKRGELFLFDVLPYAKRVEVVKAERDKCFAPLKNAEEIAAIEEALR